MKEVAPADSTPVLDELEQYLAESEESTSSSTCSRGGRPRRQSGRRLPRWSSSTSPHRPPPRASSASSRPRARCTACGDLQKSAKDTTLEHSLRGVQHRVGSRLVRGLSGSAGERQRGSAPRPSGPRALPRPRCVAAALLVRRAAVGVCGCVLVRVWTVGICLVSGCDALFYYLVDSDSGSEPSDIWQIPRYLGIWFI